MQDIIDKMLEAQQVRTTRQGQDYLIEGLKNGKWQFITKTTEYEHVRRLLNSYKERQNSKDRVKISRSISTGRQYTSC